MEVSLKDTILRLKRFLGGMCNLERWDDLTKAINSNASWPSARARNPKAGLGFHQDFLTYTYTYTGIPSLSLPSHTLGTLAIIRYSCYSTK
jgi:hypothetical protein